MTKEDRALMKEILNSVLDGMLSKFATKEDIKKLEKELLHKSEFEKKFYEMRSDIVQFKDDILKEIVKLREEVAVVGGFRDRIEEHEVRIDRLEKFQYA